ncbi:MAG: sporulation initiation inhibitor Soj [Chloroflexi bacterium HGW-Chloroflexi-10]|nr:MAG: sporulation initiation inhibitor Soj [Chloroflexi bacterium HGW-Chloroflexi-10]
MPKILAISNQKGGVAKTTSCFSIAAGLAEIGQQVLMVDLDPQANLTTACGLDPDELEWTLMDVLVPDDTEPAPAIMQIIQPTKMAGLSILPADMRLASLERLMVSQDDYELSLKRELSLLNHYDSVVIDCPPSMGALTLMGLSAAQTALIPVQCEYFASRGLMQLLDIIEIVRSQTNPTLDYYIFASMYDQRNLISRQVLESLQEHFQEHIFDTVIRIDTRLRESVMVGEPIQMYAPRTRSAEEYRQLTQEIILHLQKEE